jgi:hypothetical protein
VLEAAGRREFAAAAVGRAAPYQDNFVDTLGTVGNRLRAAAGGERGDELMRAGVRRDLFDVVGRCAVPSSALPSDSHTNGCPAMASSPSRDEDEIAD